MPEDKQEKAEPKAEKLFWSRDKEQRARNVIADPDAFLRGNGFSDICAEYRILQEGLEKKLEGEDLVEFVYIGLGGRLIDHAKAEELADRQEVPEDEQPPKGVDECPGCEQFYNILKLHAKTCKKLSKRDRKKILNA